MLLCLRHRVLLSLSYVLPIIPINALLMTVSLNFPPPIPLSSLYFGCGPFSKKATDARFAPICVAKNCSVQQCRSHPTDRIEVGVILSSNLTERFSIAPGN
ncbi:MAG: hypothetical protein [Circular genetic element sp.]|nr:MAG: hypothetical protein [Circular genetic element sp.]